MPETAQTLTSTRSVLSARARIASSVTSVSTFAAFLYQETQRAPSVWPSRGRLLLSCFRARRAGDEEVRRRGVTGLGFGDDGGAGRERGEELRVVAGRVQREDVHARLDAKFLRERRSGVSGHQIPLSFREQGTPMAARRKKGDTKGTKGTPRTRSSCEFCDVWGLVVGCLFVARARRALKEDTNPGVVHVGQCLCDLRASFVPLPAG